MRARGGVAAIGLGMLLLMAGCGTGGAATPGTLTQTTLHDLQVSAVGAGRLIGESAVVDADGAANVSASAASTAVSSLP